MPFTVECPIKKRPIMKKHMITICILSALTFAGCEKEEPVRMPSGATEDYDPGLPQEEPDEPDDPTDAPDPETIRLGTYNLWGSGPASGDARYDQYKWEARKEALARSIVDCRFGIFGFQEATRTDLPDLVAAAGGHYEWWAVGRDAQDGGRGESVGIAWDSERFELSERRWFWLSATPDIPSYGWGEAYRRIAVAAVVQDKTTGKRFFMISTHGPLDETARANAVRLLADRERAYNPDGLPSILVGDMNAAPDDAASNLLREHWEDARRVVPASAVYGPGGTFQSHNLQTNLSDETRRIDYVYVRGQAAPSSYRVDDTVYGGIYPSDHCPVIVELKIGA